MTTKHQQTTGNISKALVQPITPPEDDWPRIGETLKTFRETRGYSPKEFADRVGISRSYLVNIESGRKRLTDILLCKMAKELCIKQHAIMNPNHTN